MPQMAQNDFLDAFLTATITETEPAKAALSRVKFTKFLVEEFGTNEHRNYSKMSVRYIGIGAFKHQDPDVRQAGQDLVILLYKVDPKTIRVVMPEDNSNTRRSHAYKYVFEEMDRYDRKLRKNI